MNNIFGDLKVINLTPHPVRVLDEDGIVIAEWDSSGSLRIRYEFQPDEKFPALRSARIAGIDGLELIADTHAVIVSRAMSMVPLGLGEDVRVYYPDGEVRDPADTRIVVGCRYLTQVDDSAHVKALQAVAKEGYDYGAMTMHSFPDGVQVYNDAVATARGIS